MLPEEGEQPVLLPPFVADPVGAITRRWKPMVAIAVAGLASAAAAALLWPKAYSASTSVAMSASPLTQQYVNLTQSPEVAAQVNPLIEEVLSRESLAGLIERHGLYVDERKSMWMAELVGVARRRIDFEEKPTLSRETSRTSAVFRLTFTDSDPKSAADFVNDLASSVVAANSRMRSSQARQATEFLRAELARSEREMRAQDEVIADYKRQHRGELPSELEMNLARLNRLTELQQTLQTQLSAAESRIADLAQAGAGDAPRSHESQLDTLRARLASELAIYTEDHPNVISTRRQIAMLEKRLAEGGGEDSDDPSTPRLIRSARNEIQDLREQLARVKADTEELEEQVSHTPKREEEMEAYLQKATVLRETYLSNLRKVEAAELAESVELAQQGATVRVLDRAVPPDKPDTSPIMIVLLGIVGSLGAALAAGLLLELVDPVIVTPEQLEEFGRARVLGSVGVVAS
jgi:uncharacterized protein involved in exopolysaccharide biosynthesis